MIGGCSACGDAPRRIWQSRSLCRACFEELAHGNISPAIAEIMARQNQENRRTIEMYLKS